MGPRGARDSPDKARGGAEEPPLLPVRSLSGPRFGDIDLDVRPGEIVGLAGVEGNGQREFLRALAGPAPSGGKVVLAGRPVSLGDASRGTRAGIIHLPGDRHAEGLFLTWSVRENVSLLALGRLARLGVVGRRPESQLAAVEI